MTVAALILVACAAVGILFLIADWWAGRYLIRLHHQADVHRPPHLMPYNWVADRDIYPGSEPRWRAVDRHGRPYDWAHESRSHPRCRR